MLVIRGSPGGDDRHVRAEHDAPPFVHDTPHRNAALSDPNIKLAE
jgi:hypothetical protein